MDLVLQQDLVLRRTKIQKQMQEAGIDACVLSTAVNVFYTTGCIYNGYCYLPSEGSPVHFVKRPDVEFDNVIYIRKPEQISEELEKLGIALPKTVLIEKGAIPYDDCLRLMTVLKVEMPIDASAFMRKVRSIKTDYELAQVKECARQHEAVYKLIPSVFREGMTDVELQIEIERLMRLHGSIGIFRTYGVNMDIYMGSLLVGDNAEVASPFDYALGGAGVHPIMPLGSSGQIIKEGQAIMIDMAGNYKPWMTDMTRVFSKGKLSELAYKAHQVSIEIQTEIMQIAKPGVCCSHLYNIATALVDKYKLQAYFMGTELQAKFIGHGLGLEINEPPVFTPRSKEVLEPNVVFALEPKFVIPQVGAVGIENTFAITNTGIEKITLLEEDIIEL